MTYCAASPPNGLLCCGRIKGRGLHFCPSAFHISHFTPLPKMPPHGPAFKRHRVPRFSPLFMGDLIAPHIKSGISPNYRPRDACQGIQENGRVQTRARGDRGEKGNWHGQAGVKALFFFFLCTSTCECLQNLPCPAARCFSGAGKADTHNCL